MSLAGLPAERLLELGGLKTRCSAGLRCVAHGLNLPCALCEVEEETGRGAVCEACGHLFEQSSAELADRACGSRTAFAARGRIAFEAEALERLRALDEERERGAQAARDAARRVGETQRETEPDRIRRAERDRAQAERERHGHKPDRTEDERTPGRRLGRDLRAMAAAFVVGAVVVGAGALKEFVLGRGEATVAAAAPAAVPARAGALPAAPVANGYVTEVGTVLAPDEAAYLRVRLALLARTGFTARVLLVDSTGDEDIAAFGQRVGNTWNAAGPATRSDLLLTVAVQDRRVRIDVAEAARATVGDDAAQSLIDKHFSPAVRTAGLATGLRQWVDQLERLLAAKRHVEATEGDRMATTLSALGAIGSAVSAWDGRLAALPPSAQAVLESAVAELEAMPRPARGDRKTARQLHANGLSLVGQPGFEALAVEKLQLARAADPLDVQVLNDLAYAEMGAGHHRAAAQHLLQTLRLAPKRTSAWVNLAELAPSIVAEPDEAQATAAAMYRVGYWFSTDRAKMLGYLRARATEEEAKDAVRTAAAETLRWLEATAAPDAGSIAADRTTARRAP